MKMMRIIVCLALATVAAGCEMEPFSPTTPDQFVVQAYLYAGEPVTDVRVTALLPLGATDTIAPPINDAQVVLIKAGDRYTLVPTPGDSGFYHYAGDDLSVEVGDVFDLEVTARGVTATGRTTVPFPPAGITLSATALRPDGFWIPEPVVVRWPNPERDWFFVTHENLDPNARQIFEGTVFIRPGVIVSEPVATDSLVISRFSIRHYGTYAVRLYRVHPEYEQLYTLRRQDTRDLNEPPSNIQNGLGIFTAFSSRTAHFSVNP
jgi:hypothetical protein